MTLTSVPALPRTAPPAVESGNSPILAQGRMADAIRAHNWAATSLGPIDQWPQVMLSFVNLTLSYPIPAVVHWGPGMLMLYNDLYAELLEPNGHTFLGEPAPDVWAPLWPHIGQFFRKVLDQGISLTGGNLLIPVDRNGRLTEVFWSYAITPIYDNGKTVGIFNTALDTTESVTSLNALVASDERLRLALSATDCTGIWDWHIQSDLVYGEEDYVISFGKDPKRARIGVPRLEIFQQIHPDDRARVYESLEAAILNSTELSSEYRVPQPDGSTRWISATGHCLYAEDGKPYRFHGINIDITRRKQTEADLAEARMEAASIRWKSALASQIDPPLASIATILRLARSTDDLTEVQRFLVVAEREVNRIADLAAQSLRSAPASLPAPAHALYLPPAQPTLVWSMELLVSTVARSIAERKDEVHVEILRHPQETVFCLQLAPQDLGRFLGNQGRTARSLRTLLDAVGSKSAHRFLLEIQTHQPDPAPSPVSA